MNKALYRALPAIIIMAGGLAAQAATLNVGAGQTHTTIGAAIAAANAGDTIQIKDSGTYNESLTIGKRITIQADIGQSPVLRGDGVTTHILKTTPGSGGAQIGSNEGGQILLDGQGATTVKGVIVPSHTDVTPVVFENLRLQNLNSATNHIDPESTGASSFRYVRATGGAQMLELSNTAVMDATFNFERCRFTGMLFTGSIRQTAGRVTMVADHCEFATGGASGAFWYVTTPETGGSFTWNYCFIREEVAGLTCMLTSTHGIQMFYDHTAILSFRHCLQVFGAANNWTLRMDHCDLYGDFDGADAANTGTRSAPTMVFTASTGRNMLITNTNILSNNVAQSGWSEGDNNAADDVQLAGNYNNHQAPRNANAPAGANDVATPVLPDYGNVVGGNFRYTTASLRTAGEGGTPIGSMTDFTTIDAIPVNRLGTSWTLY